MRDSSLPLHSPSPSLPLSLPPSFPASCTYVVWCVRCMCCVCVCVDIGLVSPTLVCTCTHTKTCRACQENQSLWSAFQLEKLLARYAALSTGLSFSSFNLTSLLTMFSNVSDRVPAVLAALGQPLALCVWYNMCIVVVCEDCVYMHMCLCL